MRKVAILGGGISGLATAYNLQEMAKAEGLNINLTLIEKEPRLGGKIQSLKEKGFLCESGPAAFLDNKPETQKLIKDLGIDILPSREAAKKRFIFSGSKLKRVPEKPGAFLKSDILSVMGKLRVLFEVFTRPSKKRDETIAEFGERHLGKEAQKKLISAMVVGIFAGDSEKLSIKSCFPIMLALEKEGNGSLLRAMFKRMKAAKKNPNIKAMPSANLSSFIGGMQELTEALSSALDCKIITGTEALNVKRNDNSGYKLKLDKDNENLDVDVVIFALPSYETAKILGDLNEELKNQLVGIPYVPASVVCLGFKKEDVLHSLDGYGFLIPKLEGRRILGCRWDTSTFENRSNQGEVLLWAIVGGDLNPELALLNDESIIKLVNEELQEIIGVEKDPIFVKVIKHDKAIPQYLVGHSERLEKIDRVLDGFPGLFLTGNAFKGVGVNDCTRNATLTAKRVVSYLSGEP
jgi:oxygen-dependent protoporphyrinogen oxidase